MERRIKEQWVWGLGAFAVAASAAAIGLGIAYALKDNKNPAPVPSKTGTPPSHLPANNGQNAQLEKRAHALNKRTYDLKKVIFKLGVDLNSADQEAGLLNGQLQALNDELTTKNNDLSTALQKISELEQSLTDLKNMYSQRKNLKTTIELKYQRELYNLMVSNEQAILKKELAQNSLIHALAGMHFPRTIELSQGGDTVIIRTNFGNYERTNNFPISMYLSRPGITSQFVLATIKEILK